MTVSATRIKQERAIEQCKGVLKHAWYPSTTDRTPEFGTYIANRCERCDTERLMIVDRFGNALTKWRYVYVDKNLYKAIAAESMAEWRVRYLASLTKKRVT